MIGETLLLLLVLAVEGCAPRSVPVYDRGALLLTREDSARLGNCPCSRWHETASDDDEELAAASLCLPVAFGGSATASGASERKEIFAFSVATDDRWKHYDWGQLTTVAWNEDKALLCHAHSKGVKVVVKHNFDDVVRLCDPSVRRDWIQVTYSKIVQNYADGVNIDTEKPMNGATSHCLALLVQELRRELELHALTKNAQITFDVPWAPRGVDGRYYPWRELAAAVDFLFVMSYDMRSQIYDACLAGANSPLALVKQGLREFLLGYEIDPAKLVLGVPWYGYKYPCQHATTAASSSCQIQAVPFFDAPCSDAAGSQVDYGDIRRLIRTQGLVEQWDAVSESPFVWDSPVEGSQHFQIWFDSPRSLAIKYRLVRELQLRGVGMWNADTLDYSEGALNDTRLMWNALQGAF